MNHKKIDGFRRGTVDCIFWVWTHYWMVMIRIVLVLPCF